MNLDTPAKRLRWVRENRTNYSTGTDAARAFGWTVSTYLGHENGDRQPSVKAAKRYAAAYKVPLGWILAGGPLVPPLTDNPPTPTNKTQRAILNYDAGEEIAKDLLNLLRAMPEGSEAEKRVVRMLRRLNKDGDDK
jgi:transcriptional regulator with XRE-family HTH domain